MFVPPEHRQPGPPPWLPPRRRALSKRGETVMLRVVCFCLLVMLLAPIGGSTVIEAVWFLLRR